MDLYEKNMALLRRQAASFAEWTAAAPPDPRTRLLRTSSGRPNLRWQDPRGETYCLYDAGDPLELEREQARTTELQPGQATVIFGLGLGYRLLALAERMNRGHIPVSYTHLRAHET